MTCCHYMLPASYSVRVRGLTALLILGLAAFLDQLPIVVCGTPERPYQVSRDRHVANMMLSKVTNYCSISQPLDHGPGSEMENFI